MKQWFLPVSALLILGCFIPSRASAAAPVGVQIDGRPVHFPDVPPMIVNDRVLVPTRGLAEGLDASVSWYPASRTIYMANARHSAQITVGSTHAWSDAWMFKLDVPPIIVDGRTMMPARFVAEALGASVEWDDARRTVVISTTAPVTATAAEVEQAINFISPFAEVDEYQRFIPKRPPVFLPLRPAVVKALVQGAITMVPTGVGDAAEQKWLRVDTLTEAALVDLGLAIGGPDFEGLKEPVLVAAAKARQTNYYVRTWWGGRWYVSDALARRVQKEMRRRIITMEAILLLVSATPENGLGVWRGVTFGIGGGKLLTSVNADRLDDCIEDGQGRGVVISALFGKSFIGCEPR